MFKACYCDALDAKFVPAESFDGGVYPRMAVAPRCNLAVCGFLIHRIDLPCSCMI